MDKWSRLGDLNNYRIISILLTYYHHINEEHVCFFKHNYSPVEGGFGLPWNPVSSHFRGKSKAAVNQSKPYSLYVNVDYCLCTVQMCNSGPPKHKHALTHACTKLSLVYCFVHIVLTLKTTHLMNRPGVKVQLLLKPVIYLQAQEPHQDSLILR